MDGLDEFEKTLAAEKAERERSERDEKRSRKHRHHHRDEKEGRDDDRRERHRHRDHDGDEDRHRHRHRRHRDDDEHRHRRHGDDDKDGHRHKRSRHDDDSRSSRHDDRHHKTTDAKEDLPLPDEEKPPSQNAVETGKPLQRDAWMTAPSALDIEYVNRREKEDKPAPPAPEPKRVIHRRELNSTHLEELNAGGASVADVALPKPVSYIIGDAGSSWRMTKLRAVYAAAEESGRPVEELALERYGSLEDFDEAREEKEEMERRNIYGQGYVGKEKPMGELYRERVKASRGEQETPAEPVQGAIVPDQTAPAPVPTTPAVDQTTLNRLRAQMMKAKLRRAPNAAQLEDEYNRAAAAFAANPVRAPPEAVVLGVMDNRQLAGTRAEAKAVETRRGRERGNVEENSDMSIADMVREERRTKGQAGGEGMRLAERIAKDGRYDDNLDYMDENAEKLARRIHKSDLALKNTAVADLHKMTRILDACPLCHHEDRDPPAPPAAPVVSLATRVYLTLPTLPEVSPGGAVVVPLSHRNNLLECDDDEWEEMRNFMKSLTRMYADQGRDVLFYENAAAPHRRPHAALVAVPVPYEHGAMAPAHFREAFLSADEEWAQHRKVIDTGAAATTGGLGRAAFRRSIAKEAPYFHVWFSLDGGLGHVVEDAARWPRGDLFAREVVGGIVGAEPHVVKKQGRWTRGADAARVEEFRKGWRKYDWTRMLAEEAS